MTKKKPTNKAKTKRVSQPAILKLLPACALFMDRSSLQRVLAELVSSGAITRAQIYHAVFTLFPPDQSINR